MRVNDLIYEPISTEPREILLGEFRHDLCLNAGDMVDFQYHDLDQKTLLLQYRFTAPMGLLVSWSKLFQVNDAFDRFKHYRLEIGYGSRTHYVTIIRYEERFPS